MKHPAFGKAVFDMVLRQSCRLGVAAGARGADVMPDNDPDESSACPQAGMRAAALNSAPPNVAKCLMFIDMDPLLLSFRALARFVTDSSAKSANSRHRTDSGNTAASRSARYWLRLQMFAPKAGLRILQGLPLLRPVYVLIPLRWPHLR